MVSSNQAFDKYGPPKNPAPYLTTWMVPSHLVTGAVPKKVFCNVDLVEPLHAALVNLHQSGHIDELKSWDGCFNIRQQRGAAIWSLHSWGLAVDVNAASNAFKAPPTLSIGFVDCWVRAGFDWGGSWHTPDGMHFQLKKI